MSNIFLSILFPNTLKVQSSNYVIGQISHPYKTKAKLHIWSLSLPQTNSRHTVSPCKRITPPTSSPLPNTSLLMPQLSCNWYTTPTTHTTNTVVSISSTNVSPFTTFLYSITNHVLTYSYIYNTTSLQDCNLPVYWLNHNSANTKQFYLPQF